MLSCCQPRVADCAWPLGLGSLGESLADCTVFPGLPHMPLGPPEPEVPTPAQPSGPESDHSLEQDPFCQHKAEGLYTNPLDRSSYHSCAAGRLFQQSCHRSLVLSSPCKCCTWSGVPKAPWAPAPRPEPGIPPQPASPALPGDCSLAPAGLPGVFPHPSFLLSDQGSF